MFIQHFIILYQYSTLSQKTIRSSIVPLLFLLSPLPWLAFNMTIIFLVKVICICDLKIEVIAIELWGYHFRIVNSFKNYLICGDPYANISLMMCKCCRCRGTVCKELFLKEITEIDMSEDLYLLIKGRHSFCEEKMRE